MVHPLEPHGKSCRRAVQARTLILTANQHRSKKLAPNSTSTTQRAVDIARQAETGPLGVGSGCAGETPGPAPAPPPAPASAAAWAPAPPPALAAAPLPSGPMPPLRETAAP